MVWFVHRLECSSNRLCAAAWTTLVLSCLLSHNQHRPGKGHISIGSSLCLYRASIHFLCKCPMVAIHTQYIFCWVLFLTRHMNPGTLLFLWNLDRIQTGKLNNYRYCCQTYQCHNDDMLFLHRRTILQGCIRYSCFDLCRFGKSQWDRLNNLQTSLYLYNIRDCIGTLYRTTLALLVPMTTSTCKSL